MFYCIHAPPPHVSLLRMRVRIISPMWRSMYTCIHCVYFISQPVEDRRRVRAILPYTKVPDTDEIRWVSFRETSVKVSSNAPAAHFIHYVIKSFPPSAWWSQFVSLSSDTAWILAKSQISLDHMSNTDPPPPTTYTHIHTHNPPPTLTQFNPVVFHCVVS